MLSSFLCPVFAFSAPKPVHFVQSPKEIKGDIKVINYALTNHVESRFDRIEARLDRIEAKIEDRKE